jgi:hypothetical protein
MNGNDMTACVVADYGGSNQFARGVVMPDDNNGKLERVGTHETS